VERANLKGPSFCGAVSLLYGLLSTAHPLFVHNVENLAKISGLTPDLLRGLLEISQEPIIGSRRGVNVIRDRVFDRHHGLIYGRHLELTTDNGLFLLLAINSFLKK